jgi:hypothetical protein
MVLLGQIHRFLSRGYAVYQMSVAKQVLAKMALNIAMQQPVGTNYLLPILIGVVVC